MKLSSRKKKWLTVIIVLLLIRIVAGVVLHYVITYRFKDIVQYVVTQESNGTYAFNASDINVSLWNKSMVIKNASLRCMDTLQAPSHYNLEIPRVYLRIDSWAELIFRRQLQIDSLHIKVPDIRAYAHRRQKSRHIGFHVSRIFDALQKVAARLQIRKLNLQNGSFTFRSANGLRPFVSNRINLFISNFSKENGQEGRLFAMDDLELTIENQQWKLPDGKHFLDFKKLHFSGRNQYFEIDSCTFQSLAGADSTAIVLTAEKIFFNSTQLVAIYEKDELLIDTLILHRPVVNLQTANNQPDRDSAITPAQALRQLFNGMHIRYIDVRNGEFLVNNKNKYKPTYASQETDLEVYNLRVHPDSTGISTDSVHLTLKDILFVTKDSLYQMTIGEFAIRNNHVLLQNAEFGPAPRNRKKNLVLIAPLIRLGDVNLEDLMDKKLNAGMAEVHSPVIRVTGKEKKQPGTASRSMSRFYDALHGLHELIAVKHFRIVNGHLQYQAADTKMDMDKINVHILLDHFLTSDSLIDIKRSVPELNIQSVAVQSSKMSLKVDDYSFNGLVRYNQAGALHLEAGDGTLLDAKKVWWRMLDWDLWQKEGVIKVESVGIDQLALDRKNALPASETHVIPSLPSISISKIDIGRLAYNRQRAATARLSFDAESVSMTNVRSKQHFFTWLRAMAQISHLRFQKEGLQVQVEHASFDNEQETMLKGTTIDIDNGRGTVKLQAPVLKLNTAIRSSDVSRFQAGSLVAENPVIEIYNHAVLQRDARPFAIPVNFRVNRLAVNNATLRYRTEGQKDTLSVTAGVTISAEALETRKDDDKLFVFDKLATAVAGLQVLKKDITLQATASSVILTKGSATRSDDHTIKFAAGILWKWSDASLAIRGPEKMELILGKLTGMFSNENFNFTSGTKLPWQSLVSHTTISNGSVDFTNRKITARAGSFYWNPLQKKIGVRSFQVQPVLTMEEAFERNAWQSDYITVSGDVLTANGVAFHNRQDDSMLVVKKVEVDQLSLATIRDKRKLFRHGIEKRMPGKLFGTAQFPFRIDSLLLRQSNITVEEISALTNEKVTIPLEQVNAVIANITSRPAAKDSLEVVMNARLFTNIIRRLRYRESYRDSLAGFTLQLNASAMNLPTFSKITRPLAAISIQSGRADTLYASWTGNKYAALGTMNFYYRNLKVQLLNTNDVEKKNQGLFFESLIANNLVLRNRNYKPALVFFERDREKFIFNYWVKTSLRGFLSSIGINQSRKNLKEYKKQQTDNALPVITK